MGREGLNRISKEIEEGVALSEGAGLKGSVEVMQYEQFHN